MRAKLIELTADRPTDCFSEASARASFRIAWQSSKVPATATQRTLSSAAVVMNRRWTSEMRPSGNMATMRVLARPRKASTAAPPVSPEVAHRMVWVRPDWPSTWSDRRASSCMATSLKARLGPWNNSAMKPPGAIWVRGTTAGWVKPA